MRLEPSPQTPSLGPWFETQRFALLLTMRIGPNSANQNDAIGGKLPQPREWLAHTYLTD
jgi:hypothetical protein